MRAGLSNANMIDKLKVMKKSTLFSIVGLILLGFISNRGFAQDLDYGSDPDKCRECYSLYKEYYEQKNYKDAYPYWLCTIEVCPKLTKFLYKHGANMIEDKIKKATDKEVKEKLIDSLMWNYDKWLENFDDDHGGVNGDKGVDAYKYGRLDMAYESLKKSIELEKENSTANPINFYFMSVRDKVKNGSLDTTAIFDAYQVLMEILKVRLETVEDKYKKYYETAKSNVENAFVPFATCESIVNIFGKRIEENPTDAEFMKKTLKLMEAKGCTDEPLYGQVAKKLYALEPSAAAAAAIARKEIKENKNAEEALKFYMEAIKLEQVEEDKALYYYEVAQVYYSQKKYADSRTYARKAIASKSGWGKPYILIGDLYYYTASSCGETVCSKKYGIWAAQDKYETARSVDSEVAADANSRIGKCKAQYPTVQDCFFEGTKEGDTVTVGGWIGEQTKARF